MTLGAVILAAGTGSRMREGTEAANKLLCRLGDETLLRRCCRTVESAGFEPIVVVLGHGAEVLRPEVAEGALIVVNERYAEGQSTSVARGIDELSASVEGAVFVPADQAGLDSGTLRRLADAFRASSSKSIAAPQWRERRGAPVLFGRRHFSALRDLEGDAGGRQILSELEGEVAWVSLDDELPLLDADTPSALRDVARRLGCDFSLSGPTV
ncbi:MAG: nucleotidyltransferase family protein [Acidobacteriota bacterium]